MKALKAWILSKQSKINHFAPVFFATYFLLLVIPYCTGRIPVLYDLICVNVIGRVVFRLLPTLYVFIYGFLVGIANRCKIRWEWLFPMVTLWIAYALAWIFTPDTYVYVSMSWNRSLTYSTTTIGWLDAAISFGTLIAETLILFMWISVFPSAVKTRKAVFASLIAMVAFAWLAVVLSVALEWNLYVELFKGGDHKGLHSIFFQKNEYGAFMFLGAFASASLFYISEKKAKWALAVSGLGLTMVTMLVRCYTALMSEIVILIGLLLLTIYHVRKKSHVFGYSLGGVVLGGVALVMILTFVPSIRDNQPIFRVLYNSLMSIEREVETRTVIWKHLPDVTSEYSLFLGVTDDVSEAKLGSLQIINDESVVSIFHNSYIAYLASHGLIGLLVYFALIFKAAKSCFVYSRYGRVGSIFLLFLLIGYLLQGVAETYVLFIKMSVLTLPLSLVFFVFLPAIKKEGFDEN